MTIILYILLYIIISIITLYVMRRKNIIRWDYCFYSGIFDISNIWDFGDFWKKNLDKSYKPYISLGEQKCYNLAKDQYTVIGVVLFSIFWILTVPIYLIVNFIVKIKNSLMREPTIFQRIDKILDTPKGVETNNTEVTEIIGYSINGNEPLSLNLYDVLNQIKPEYYNLNPIFVHYKDGTKQQLKND